MKRASGPLICCPRCGKKTRAQYDKKQMQFSCGKCRQVLRFSDGCRRKLLLWQMLYHLVTFAVILGIFWWVSRMNQTAAVLAAIVLITIAGGMGKPLVYYCFYQKNLFQLRDELPGK